MKSVTQRLDNGADIEIVALALTQGLISEVLDPQGSLRGLGFELIFI